MRLPELDIAGMRPGDDDIRLPRQRDAVHLLRHRYPGTVRLNKIAVVRLYQLAGRAEDATEYFRIPSDRVVEVGTQVMV